MSIRMKNALAMGSVAAVLGAITVVHPMAPVAAAPNLVQLAQVNGDPKGKGDRDTGRPSAPAPKDGERPSKSAPIPSSPTLQNAPQSGVPARCASISDPTELQKCMNTPKGQ